MIGLLKRYTAYFLDKLFLSRAVFMIVHFSTKQQEKQDLM
jgi:hypothetical protein